MENNVREFTDEFEDGTVILVREWGEPPNVHHGIKRVHPSYPGPLKGHDRWVADYSMYGYSRGRLGMTSTKDLLRIENQAIENGDWPLVGACGMEHWLRRRKKLFDSEWERIGRRPDPNWDRPNCPTMEQNLNNPSFLNWLLHGGDDDLGPDPHAGRALEVLREIMAQDEYQEHKLQQGINGE